MKSLILAAGYGTRLHPLTETTAKSLLSLGGKPIIEHILQPILRLPEIDAVYIVTNGKFFQDLAVWQETFDRRRENPLPPIHLLNDGTVSNETRLGAIRDTALAIQHFRVDDDLILAASDNIFTFDFQKLIAAFRKTRETTITLHPSEDIHRLRNTGNARIDARGRVVELIEKPSTPKTNLVSPCLYILSRTTLPLVRQYLDTNKNPDAPGHFLAWLVGQTSVNSFVFNEPFYTVGDTSSYEYAQTSFAPGK